MGNQMHAILALLAGASLARAHGYVYSWTIDGVNHRGFNPDGQEDYSGAERPTDNSQKKGNGWGPANRATGQSACGGNEAGSGLEHWPLKAGSTVVAEWSDPKNGETVWPPPHVGPMLEYMAKCPGDSCDGVPADSLDWFKIGEATYDGSAWPTEKITGGEDWTFTIPDDLAPGAYLVRHEIIALHWAWDEPNDKGFELYPYCFQANLESSGSAAPSDTTTFPAAYSKENYQWYDYSVPWDNRDPNDYVPPGPPVYTGGGGGGSTAPVNATSTTTAEASEETTSLGNELIGVPATQTATEAATQTASDSATVTVTATVCEGDNDGAYPTPTPAPSEGEGDDAGENNENDEGGEDEEDNGDNGDDEDSENNDDDEDNEVGEGNEDDEDNDDNGENGDNEDNGDSEGNGDGEGEEDDEEQGIESTTAWWATSTRRHRRPSPTRTSEAASDDAESGETAERRSYRSWRSRARL